uniref:PBPe domain-containing protein n=1 Tax=Steinernema glaseri TaxID=37863 RepID=A0A1I8A843_9BILA
MITATIVLLLSVCSPSTPSSIVCYAHSRGMLALFLPNEFPYDLLAANYADTIGIPYFRLAPRSLLQQFHDSAIDLFPDPRSFGTAALGFVKHQRWHNVVLLQRTAEEFTDIQDLVTESYFIEHLKVTPKVLPSEGDYGPILKRLKIQMNARNIVIHTEPRGLAEVLREANVLGMCSKDFGYVLTHPDATLLQMESALWAHCNVTAFSMLDYFSEEARRMHEFLSRAGIISSASKYTIPLHIAVWSDALRLLNSSLQPIGYPDEQRRCDVPFATGRAIRDSVLKARFSGLTGSFCQWDTAKKRLLFEHNLPTRMEGRSTSIRNRTLKVTVYLEEPFVMLKSETQNQTGNDRYEGYLIDLLQRIAEVRGFRYVLHEVRDKSYGVKEAHGKWNGMVGELQSGEADLAVASLTISYSRSEVIDFTVPYMHLGISILFKKPEETHPSLFAFLSPLSVEVWISMAGSYIVASAAIWLLAKISPYENLRQEDDGSFVECPNQFTLFNSFWFTVSSLMQQGADLSPRAGSTRLGAAFWWLFTLIFISSYTANLAAFLTAQRMVSPIESANDLAEQTKIKFGTLGRGSTMTFFNESKIDIYEKMWKTMTSQPGLFVNSSREGIERVLSSDYAYLMESSMLEYAVERNCQLMQIGGLLDQKGYGIGLPKGSPYREPISTAILRLQETTVLTELKEKWWKKKRGGGICTPQKVTQTELGARSVGGIFIVLLVGLLVAIFASAFELIKKATETAQTQSTSVLDSAWKDVKKSFDERRPSRARAEAKRAEEAEDVEQEEEQEEKHIQFVPLEALRPERPVDL